MDIKEASNFLKQNGYVEIEIQVKISETISFRLGREFNAKLESLANEKKITKSTLIKGSIEGFILSQQDFDRDEVLLLSTKALAGHNKMLTVRLHKDVVKKINEIAGKLRVSRTDVIRYAIYKFLQQTL